LLPRSLTFRVGGPAREVAPPAEIPVASWQPNDGVGAAPVLGWRCGGLAFLQFPGFARYVFESGSSTVSGYPFAGASSALLQDVYQRAVLPILLQDSGTEVLHASAIDTQAGVVAFAARSGTGKSTLAYEFGERGYGVWADDALAWDVRDGEVITFRLPFSLRLSGGRRIRASTHCTRADSVRRLAAVVVMRRSDGLERLVHLTRPKDLLPAILPHAYSFSTQERGAGGLLTGHYLDLVTYIPVYELLFNPGLDHIGDVMDIVASGLRLSPMLGEQIA